MSQRLAPLVSQCPIFFSHAELIIFRPCPFKHNGFWIRFLLRDLAQVDVLSVDIEILEDRLRFWMVNHRPPVDSAGKILQDATRVGANSTIEIFDHTRGSSNLEHVKTISSNSIISPNSLAPVCSYTEFLLQLSP